MIFRSRSRLRDQQNDLRRQTLVSNAVDTVLNECIREREGLQRRLETVRASAAMLMGNTPYGEPLTREEETMLSEAATDLDRATERLRVLDAMIAEYAELARAVPRPKKQQDAAA